MAGPVQEGSDSRVDLHTRENKESNLNSTNIHINRDNMVKHLSKILPRELTI